MIEAARTDLRLDAFFRFAGRFLAVLRAFVFLAFDLRLFACFFAGLRAAFFLRFTIFSSLWRKVSG